VSGLDQQFGLLALADLAVAHAAEGAGAGLLEALGDRWGLGRPGTLVGPMGDDSDDEEDDQGQRETHERSFQVREAMATRGATAPSGTA
jgi:hypothetical protein